MRYAGKGLSATLCRFHSQYKARHGSTWKRSYSAAELEVYRATAERYVRARACDPWIVGTLAILQATLDAGGPNERPVDTIRMKPHDKARAVLARLRTKGVPSMRLLIECAAVAMALAEDRSKPHEDGDEFRNVQVAKLCLRKAGGFRFNRYGAQQQQDNGIQFGGFRVNVGKAQSAKRWAVYTGSRGLMLRHLGQMLYEPCEDAIGRHLEAMLEAKRKWYGGSEAA
jgi:hypothetical protein